MAAPTAPPEGSSTEIAHAGAYCPGQPVWVYRNAWQPGVVLDASPRAVLVRYRYYGRALGVDTVLPYQVAPRDEADPLIDGTTP